MPDEESAGRPLGAFVARVKIYVVPHLPTTWCATTQANQAKERCRYNYFRVMAHE
jgi:hypothetical protein